MRIEITIERSIPSNDWLRVASKRARAIASERGIDWKQADVHVTLPEHGRCLTKSPGFTELTAHG